MRLEDKIEHLSSFARIVHITAKQLISFHGQNENVCEMSKNRKMHMQSRQNHCLPFSHVRICGVLVAVIVMVA